MSGAIKKSALVAVDSSCYWKGLSWMETECEGAIRILTERLIKLVIVYNHVIYWAIKFIFIGIINLTIFCHKYQANI